MDSLQSYYREHPMERLERDISGLQGLRDLLCACSSDENAMHEVRAGSLASLVELIQDDMERAVLDVYSQQNAD